MVCSCPIWTQADESQSSSKFDLIIAKLAVLQTNALYIEMWLTINAIYLHLICVWSIYIYMFFNHVYLTYTSSSTHLPWQCPLPTGSCKPFARSRKLQIELHSSLIWADYSCHSCQPQLGSPLLGAMKCSQWFIYALICMHMYRDLCH